MVEQVRAQADFDTYTEKLKTYGNPVVVDNFMDGEFMINIQIGWIQ